MLSSKAVDVSDNTITCTGRVAIFSWQTGGEELTTLYVHVLVSLPAISKTREISVLTPTKEGEAPKLDFVIRKGLRPRPIKATSGDITDLLPPDTRRGSIEKRRSQYKRVKSHNSLDFTNWKDRDEEWRAQRLANYMSTSKVARESTMFKKRKRKFMHVWIMQPIE